MKNKLSLKAKKSWFISRFIFLMILIVLSIVVRYILSNWLEDKFILDLVLGIIILLQLINTLVYPNLEYKQWNYEINEEKVEFSEGIYVIKRSLIPTVRIQHLNITQGPINRLLGLADVHITTAGGSFTIPNLDKKEAENLSFYLKDIIQLNLKDNVENIGEKHEK